jgi:hypothetical protein
MMMKDDPTIEQIREIRRRISAMCDHNPRKLVEYYMEFQKKYQNRLSNPVEIADGCEEKVVGVEPVMEKVALSEQFKIKTQEEIIMDAYEKAQEQFKREKQAYWAMRDNLMKDYYGIWVAVVNGQIVTSGKNKGRIGYEAYLKTGSEVCFCAQVGFEDRVLRLRQKVTKYFH